MFLDRWQSPISAQRHPSTYNGIVEQQCSASQWKVWVTQIESNRMDQVELVCITYSTQLWLSRNFPPVVFPIPPCQHFDTFGFPEARPANSPPFQHGAPVTRAGIPYARQTKINLFRAKKYKKAPYE